MTNNKRNDTATDVFRNMSVPKAVMKNAVPAVMAMLMVLVYNLADTFFIGQTHVALQVTAISLATPVFLFFMAVGTIFGIGGTSVISRAMGEGRNDYARKVSAFCMWACVVVGVVIRAEGQSTKAMMGQVIGNLLNVILDPIFILGFNWGVKGAAIATVIGNVVGALYYIMYFLKGKSMLSISIREAKAGDGIMSGVLAIGVPAAIGSLLMSLSSIVVNAQMADYGDLAVAGIGVAMKVTMITGMICIGFGQGVQPLLGYCVGAKLWSRFKESMKYSVIISFAMSAIMTVLCYLFVDQIVGAFLTNKEALSYGIRFSKILLSTSFLFGLYYVLINAIQAMGASREALVINASRQGLIYIPMLFILQAMVGIDGLVWAQPVADILSTALVIYLYKRAVRKMQDASVEKA